MTAKDQQIVISSDNFFAKVSRMADLLRKDPTIKCFIVNLGLVKDEITQPHSCMFHLWLLAFEFSETVIAITKNELVILTSKRKKEIL